MKDSVTLSLVLVSSALSGVVWFSCTPKTQDSPADVSASVTTIAKVLSQTVPERKSAQPSVVVPVVKSSSIPQFPPGSMACTVVQHIASEGRVLNAKTDLSNANKFIELAAQSSLTFDVKQTEHQVTIKGPARFQACTGADPDVITVAFGDVSIKPGKKELTIATPAFLFHSTQAQARLQVTPAIVYYEIESGDATWSSLDMHKYLRAKDKGFWKRFDEGGVLLTRCSVYVAGVHNTDHLLSQIQQDAGPVLPSASVGILRGEAPKYARYKSLVCHFAQAHAMACDEANKAFEADAGPAPQGCRAGVLQLQSAIAKAAQSNPLPVWAPHPPVPSTLRP